MYSSRKVHLVSVLSVGITDAYVRSNQFCKVVHNESGKPKVAGHLEHALKRIVDNYNKSHTDQIVATPHVLRHTFCTDKAHQKIQIKELQYLMGHADAGTTLNIYMHSDYDAAERAFREAVSG